MGKYIKKILCHTTIRKLFIKKIKRRKVEENMEDILKNIRKSEVLKLKDELSYEDGQVISKTLVQNSSVSITLFSFAKGEEISTHESSGDAFVFCLDGTGQVTIDGENYELNKGDSIVMPAKHPHAVFGKERFKMMLVVVF